MANLAIGDKVIHVTSGRKATILAIGDKTDINAIRIITDGALLALDTRKCFVTKL